MNPINLKCGSTVKRLPVSRADRCITSTNVVFHDDDGTGTDRDWFAGVIDEIRVYNASPSAAELITFVVPVEPRGKLTTMWGEVKAIR